MPWDLFVAVESSSLWEQRTNLAAKGIQHVMQQTILR